VQEEKKLNKDVKNKQKQTILLLQSSRLKKLFVNYKRQAEEKKVFPKNFS
jgi:hypothetical protein